MSREFRWLARELRPGPRARRSALAVVLGWLLRHLPEIVAVLLAVKLWSASVGPVGRLWTVLFVAAMAGAAVSWQRSRRWLLALLGCLVTRYRLRTALIELRLTTRAGRLPLTLWPARTPVGERVWLWCRAGISAEDIADEVDGIRAACAAREIRVTRDQRWAALVVIEVIRRDPLSATAVVRSPLAGRHGWVTSIVDLGRRTPWSGRARQGSPRPAGRAEPPHRR
jgi:hypothetical protein